MVRLSVLIYCLRLFGLLTQKNGKVRAVPVSPWIIEKIKGLAYPSPYSNFFDGCKIALRFALKLQRVLGHTDLKVTMRYAHMSPGYLSRVIDLGLSKECFSP